ncbi:membrane protein [Streptomyces lincolnensis]|uniref:Membrane protein n=1 Tax=Streptomyces lincolnensis TaxID=1915 RepID=A0A1B1M3K7_STRLN|nr:hypothetical protein [Streptomyces lincolnensis]ANS63230.1 membrane protein [Streptomyces lincolnensis]AXG52153.1 membrane protein [Streptomyces lincolnensis]QMV05129.1 hypothetical protein GJU35_05325 [Streptomyces lincolnensis]
MRSARMMFATATATAALALGAPAAHAAATGDWDHENSSYSKEHDNDRGHDTPRGGIHTGGGALTAVNEDDWGVAKDPKHDPETYRDKGDGGYEEPWNGGKHDKDEWSGKQDKHDNEEWKGEHDKPRGGMHTGGGGLASTGVTAGGLAVLAVAGTGVYALRRKKAAEGVA